MDRKTFESLASETRIAILKSLDVRQKTVTELARDLGLAKSTVHEHLEKMGEAGLVEKREDHRKWSYYGLTGKGKRLLHPHEQVRILVLLGTSLLAAAGGLREIARYAALSGRLPSSRSIEMATAEMAPLKAPPEAVAPPGIQPLMISGLLLLLAAILGSTALRRWRRLGSGTRETV
jgi:DNA-binding transcriptional ArsR family regulator